MKKIISLLLSLIMVFSMFATANATNELAGAKNYTLGSSKSGSILEGDESDIYKFELSNPAKISINLSANIYRLQLKLYDENGRTLVPLRAIFEALGADVQWDGNTQTVTATKGGTQISLQIGSTRMYVNGNAKTLDVPAKLINSRTLVPVRAISEAFGCKVDWIQDTQTVVIAQ